MQTQRSEQEILKYALESGMINLDTIQEQIEMNERLKYLEMHPYKVWQGSDKKWYTYLPDEQGRILKKRTTEAAIQQLIVDFWKVESDNPTITDIFHEWNDRKLDLKQIGQATHLRNRQIFNRHYNVFGQRKIKYITEEDVSDFLEEQIPLHGLTAKAFANLKGVTRGIFRRAKKRKLISFSIEETLLDMEISEKHFRPVIKEDYEEVFNEEETAKMIPYLLEHQDQKNLAILLMFVSGMRVGEIVALAHDVVFDDYIKVKRTETRYYSKEQGCYVYEVKDSPKTKAGIREVFLPEGYCWLYQKLKELNPTEQYVFLADCGTRMTTHGVRSRLRYLCQKLNIYHKSPHKARKTYGSILLDNNIDQRFILDQMGHTDISCTENHYHRNRKDKNKKTQVLSQIPEFQVK